MALPEITDGGRTWTIRVKPGILFADDPVFKGRPRELVAADYVYSIKRRLDPNLKQGGEPALTDLLVGARPVVDAARKAGKFDYDAKIDGLEAVDRHTLRLKLAAVDYTVLERLATLGTYAVAREAVEAAGDDVTSKPVGHRPVPPGRVEARLAGGAGGESRVPDDQLSRQQRPGAPADGEGDAGPQAAGAVADRDLRRRGAAAGAAVVRPGRARLRRASAARCSAGCSTTASSGRSSRGAASSTTATPVPALIYTYLNQDDPVVGGNTPERIALRRAIAMGFNSDEFIKVFYAGQGVPANQILPPGTSGHDPKLPAKGFYDAAGARALLDRFGYKDRDGDGFRETPDGKPLVLVQNSLPDSESREADTLWLKNMAAIGLKMTVNSQPFNELLKRSTAGQLMMFNLGFRASEPSGYSSLTTLWGKAPPDTNRARFRNADYDRAFEAFLRTPDGPERIALARRMSEVVSAYVPIVLQVFPVGNAFTQPWLLGYNPSPFGFTWKYMDIDLAKKKAAGK